MRTSALLALVAIGGCGGSPPANNLANFTGATWTGALSVGGTCSNNTTIPIVAVPGEITFQSTAANEVEYTNKDGCLFKFNVSGDTATLSNGPVKCGTVLVGVALDVTWTKYDATTTNGHNLTADVAYSTLAANITCNFTGNGSASR